MTNEKMESMEDLTKQLKLNTIKCNSWVAKTQNLVPEKQELGTYEKADGSEIQVVEVTYDNDDVYQVSENRFWKKKAAQ